MQFIIIILTAIMYELPLLVLLPFKLKSRHKISLFLVIFLNLLLMSFVYNNLGIIPLLISVCVYLCILDYHHLRNIIVFIISYLLNVIINNGICIVAWIIFGITTLELQSNSSYMIMICTLQIIGDFFICHLFVYLFRQLSSRYHSIMLPKSALVSISVNILLTLVLFIINIVAGETIGYPPSVIYFNTSIFLIYFLISTLTAIRSFHVSLKENEQLLKQNSFEALQEYTAQLETLYNNLRSFKHDYINILMTMYGYIDNEDINGLRKYFNESILPQSKQLDPQNSQITRLSNLKNTELKSIITTKLIYAQEMGININIEIATPVKVTKIDIVDLTRIIGIFLDNAIEGSLETSRPQIKFICINSEDEIVFIINNTCKMTENIPIQKLFQSGISTKGQYRGLGLSNVTQIINRYTNLYLDTQIIDSEFIQTLHIFS